MIDEFRVIYFLVFSVFVIAMLCVFFFYPICHLALIYLDNYLPFGEP